MWEWPTNTNSSLPRPSARSHVFLAPRSSPRRGNRVGSHLRASAIRGHFSTSYGLRVTYNPRQVHGGTSPERRPACEEAAVGVTPRTANQHAAGDIAGTLRGVRCSSSRVQNHPPCHPERGGGGSGGREGSPHESWCRSTGSAAILRSLPDPHPSLRMTGNLDLFGAIIVVEVRRTRYELVQDDTNSCWRGFLTTSEDVSEAWSPVSAAAPAS
jgi:hypothetical protein